jgi:F0F1-type ATP synthase assembly protein I
MEYLLSSIPFEAFLLPVLYGLIVGTIVGIFSVLRDRKPLVFLWAMVSSIIGVYVGAGLGFFLFKILHPNPDFLGGMALITFFLVTGMVTGSVTGAELGVFLFERLRLRRR